MSCDSLCPATFGTRAHLTETIPENEISNLCLNLYNSIRDMYVCMHAKMVVNPWNSSG